jgi:oligoribonuclease NrnB/cAMP/cGMP phosphodiesterase (DHH superfamily)
LLDTKENDVSADLKSLAFERGVCLYHNDPDGQCSAAVVRRALGPDVLLFSLEIGDPLPWEEIDAADLVVIVDYSLALEDMQRIRANASLVWIDHHVTALDRLGEAMADIPGQRRVDEAGCVLTWLSFFPDQPVPKAVVYIGDRDIWRHAHSETRPFGEGFYQMDGDPSNDDLWHPLLDDDPELVAGLISDGEKLYEARLHEIHQTIEGYGYEVEFEGHRTLAVNDRGTGDMGEAIRQAGYEIAYCYVETVRSGQRQTFVTLYSADVDVSVIAKKYGGGGHRGAAGFSLHREDQPFPRGSITPPTAPPLP